MAERLASAGCLAPNWEDHDAATCIIIKYFADRKNTEITLRKQENLIAETCCYCNECKNCTKLKTYREEFKKKVIGHSINTLNIGMFTIQIGRLQLVLVLVFSLEPLIRK